MNNREVILENYNNPFHRGKKEADNYKVTKVINTNCADELDIYLKIEDEIIKDLWFDGEACAIAIAGTSLVFKVIIDKSISEALAIIAEYHKLLNHEETNSDILGELNAMAEIYKTPNRIKCAFLAADGINKLLRE